MSKMIWTGENTFSVGGQKFFCDTRGPKERVPSSLETFTVVKKKNFFEQYIDLRNNNTIDSILELGIFYGGSAAFFLEFFDPKAFVAIEKSKERIGALDEYIQVNDLADSASCYYDMDQADRGEIEKIVKNHFSSGIDLVIDDASHDYELSKKSFEIIFPHMKAGSHYIVEDWSWPHSPAAQNTSHGRNGSPGLTNLLFEAVMALGTNSQIIESVCVYPNLFIVKKGEANLKADFNIESSYRVRSDWPFKYI